MGWMIFALSWGFAEATLFFVVPDVLLTIIALKSGKRAIKACFGALAGALIGGTIMYLWGIGASATAFTFVEKVPAIDVEMIDEVKQDIASDGLWAMMLGPAQGIPYKIYAVAAAGQSISFETFFLVSIPARLIRFLLTSVLAWAISRFLLPRVSIQTKLGILAGVWILFYMVYFWLNPS